MPKGEATVWVLVDNQNYTTLAQTFSFSSGSTHTLQVLNLTLYNSASRAKYVWKQWSFNTTGNVQTTTPTLQTPIMNLNYTSAQAGKFIAEFQKLFPLSLTFIDPTGLPVSPPALVTLQNGSIVETTSPSTGPSLPAGVWELTNVTSEEVGNAEFNTQSINGTNGPLMRSVVIRAYEATIHLLDRTHGPLQGAVVTVTFANSASRSFITDSQGNVQLRQVPLGPYGATIAYQGKPLGTWKGNASSARVL